jgi:imidazoleglycerol phosphate synthase glutamine amidotransferase subunit HisH
MIRTAVFVKSISGIGVGSKIQVEASNEREGLFRADGLEKVGIEFELMTEEEIKTCHVGKRYIVTIEGEK